MVEHESSREGCLGKSVDTPLCIAVPPEIKQLVDECLVSSYIFCQPSFLPRNGWKHPNYWPVEEDQHLIGLLAVYGAKWKEMDENGNCVFACDGRVQDSKTELQALASSGLMLPKIH